MPHEVTGRRPNKLKKIQRDFVNPHFRKTFALLEEIDYAVFILKNNKVIRFDKNKRNDESCMFLFLHTAKHAALIQKYDIKGHARCFCEKGDKIRRCHPDTRIGIMKLRQDIKDLGIVLE